MKKMLLVLSLSLVIIFSCKKENEEDLIQNCNTENVSYSADIVPIIQTNCNSCHNDQFASGGIMLHNYQNVKVHVDNGKLLGSIKHQTGFSAMPQGQDKLPECNISKIEAWANDGAQDN